MKPIHHKRAPKPLTENQKVMLSLKHLRRLINEAMKKTLTTFSIEWIASLWIVMVPDGLLAKRQKLLLPLPLA